MQTQTLPKFKVGDRVIYRLKTARQDYDFLCRVLDVIYSQQHGWCYQLSELKKYFDSDIKTEESLRANH